MNESSATVTFRWQETSTPTNNPPVADAGDDVSGNEGSAISLDGSGSYDPDGDALTYSWAIDTSGIDSGGSCSFDDSTSATPNLTCTDDSGAGTFTATLTVTDTSGASDSDTATVDVNNVAPVITAGSFTCPTSEPIPVNTPLNFGGSFTDAGTNDTHTALYTWGDGSTSQATTLTEPSGSTAGSVTGSHTYTTPGLYTPSLTVTDDDNGEGTESCEGYIVIYDPSAGFVTGGGWIDSPAGAYAADVTLTGKATFGFVSKYKKGTTVPDGNTEFQFKAGDLNFKSTSYQWLVVSGSDRATFKGYGTINGEGSYGFLLSVKDGSPDLFRIKIWNVATSTPVYDNQVIGDTGDNAVPTTALGGGSIVIHTGKK